MRFQKIIVGLLFILILGGAIFSFFYFSYGDVMLEKTMQLLPDFSVVVEEKEQKIDEGEEIWSPGPLVREDENGVGFLTREGIIEETNNQRGRFNAGPLSENEKLNRSAEIKLEDMFEGQYFAHVSPSGEGVGDIAGKITYEYLLIGDNLAMGSYRDDEDVVSAWMNSPGHRKNILEEKYEEIGVAAGQGNYQGKEVWMAVQVFGMPVTACPQVDFRLAMEIDMKKEEAEKLLQQREDLQKEIDNIRPRGSEEHIQKVEEYNALVERYNNLVKELDGLIDKYNRQIELRDECIRR